MQAMALGHRLIHVFETGWGGVGGSLVLGNGAVSGNFDFFNVRLSIVGLLVDSLFFYLFRWTIGQNRTLWWQRHPLIQGSLFVRHHTGCCPKRPHSQDWEVSSGCLSQDHLHWWHYFVWLIFLLMKFILEEMFSFRFMTHLAILESPLLLLWGCV